MDVGNGMGVACVKAKVKSNPDASRPVRRLMVQMKRSWAPYGPDSGRAAVAFVAGG